MCVTLDLKAEGGADWGKARGRHEDLRVRRSVSAAPGLRTREWQGGNVLHLPLRPSRAAEAARLGARWVVLGGRGGGVEPRAFGLEAGRCLLLQGGSMQTLEREQMGVASVAALSGTPGPSQGSLPDPQAITAPEDQLPVTQQQLQTLQLQPTPFPGSSDPDGQFLSGWPYVASRHLIPDTSDGNTAGSPRQWALGRGARQTPISLTAAPPARDSAWPLQAVARLGPRIAE